MSSTSTIAVSPGLWGVRAFVASDVATFVALYVAALVASDGSAPMTPAPSLDLALLATVCLAAVSLCMVLAVRRGGQRRWLAGAAMAALAFVVLTIVEWRALLAAGVDGRDSLSAATFFTLTGFHWLHVIAGLVALRWAKGHESTLRSVALYWHAVDSMWLMLLVGLYLP